MGSISDNWQSRSPNGSNELIKLMSLSPILILVGHLEEVFHFWVGNAHPLRAHEVGVLLVVQPPVFILVRIAVLLIERRVFADVRLKYFIHTCNWLILFLGWLQRLWSLFHVSCSLESTKTCYQITVYECTGTGYTWIMRSARSTDSQSWCNCDTICRIRCYTLSRQTPHITCLR